MKNGIYFVTFNSNLSEYGEATVVVKDGILNGGNYVCFYHGRIVDNILTLDVKKYNPELGHVFGHDDKYRLLLVLKENKGDYFMVGEMLENPDKQIEATANFIGDVLY